MKRLVFPALIVALGLAILFNLGPLGRAANGNATGDETAQVFRSVCQSLPMDRDAARQWLVQT